MFRALFRNTPRPQLHYAIWPSKTHHAWKWDEEEQKTLDKLKQALTGDRVITYFDPRKETKIIVDGSPVGLGGLLAQDREIICYASCALSEIERRYSQTEREIHAAVWALEHFHLNVYDAKFSNITDHKLLLGIFKSSKPTSARIDRWKLRFMPCDCHLLPRKGRRKSSWFHKPTSESFRISSTYI